MSGQFVPRPRRLFEGRLNVLVRGTRSHRLTVGCITLVRSRRLYCSAVELRQQHTSGGSRASWRKNKTLTTEDACSGDRRAGERGWENLHSGSLKLGLEACVARLAARQTNHAGIELRSIATALGPFHRAAVVPFDRGGDCAAALRRSDDDAPRPDTDCDVGILIPRITTAPLIPLATDLDINALGHLGVFRFGRDGTDE
jgi:hypothetical protein